MGADESGQDRHRRHHSTKWAGKFQDSTTSTCRPQKWSLDSIHVGTRLGTSTSPSVRQMIHEQMPRSITGLLRFSFQRPKIIIKKKPKVSWLACSKHSAILCCYNRQFGHSRQMKGKGEREKREHQGDRNLFWQAFSTSCWRQNPIEICLPFNLKQEK